MDVENLIEEDQPGQAIWELVGQLDLESFYAGLEAVAGVAEKQVEVIDALLERREVVLDRLKQRGVSLDFYPKTHYS